MTTSRFWFGIPVLVLWFVAASGASAQAVDFDKASNAAISAITTDVAGPQAGLTSADVKSLNERYVKHLEWQYDFAQHSWNWHFYSTILLFFIVLLIVAFGLRITYLQFQRDFGSKLDSPPAQGGATQGTPAATSTMKLSAAGLELSSQIIGLFVLGFSLAFFYLYVKEVYPIQVLNLNQSQTVAEASKNKGADSGKEAGSVRP